MIRLAVKFCAVALLVGPIMAAEKSPSATYVSARPAPDITACLADKIGEFQAPQVRPGEGGVTRIVTKNMYVTMIDLTIIPGAETLVEVRNKSSKKLRSIMAACQAAPR